LQLPILCNVVSYTITYIYCRQFNVLRQDISGPNFKVRPCFIRLPDFTFLLLLQELKEIMQSRRTVKYKNIKEIQKIKSAFELFFIKEHKTQHEAQNNPP